MDGQESSARIYEPLPPNTIRVLDILPAAEHDPIQVQLRLASIDDPGKFEALSYTWGSATDFQEILCNGNKFMVTPNLFGALKRFRYKYQSRRLWIDALCIDQSSLTERAHQVNLMRNIYSKAEKVLMWMGEENLNVDLDFAFKVALVRCKYAISKKILESPKGVTPVFIINYNADTMNILRDVRDHLDSMDSQQHDAFTLDRSGEFSTSIYVGHKELPRYVQVASPTDGISIWPEFNAKNVTAASREVLDYEPQADTPPPTFADFLVDATKPAELNLSDQQVASVWDAMWDLTRRSYCRRAWIVQNRCFTSDDSLWAA